MAEELIYRENIEIDTADHHAVLSIIDDTFGLDVEPLKTFDLFDPTYRSFSYFNKAGCCVANASTIDLPFCLNGARITAMSVQSVAASSFA